LGLKLETDKFVHRLIHAIFKSLRQHQSSNASTRFWSALVKT